MRCRRGERPPLAARRCPLPGPLQWSWETNPSEQHVLLEGRGGAGPSDLPGDGARKGSVGTPPSLQAITPLQGRRTAGCGREGAPRASLCLRWVCAPGSWGQSRPSEGQVHDGQQQVCVSPLGTAHWLWGPRREGQWEGSRDPRTGATVPSGGRKWGFRPLSLSHRTPWGSPLHQPYPTVSPSSIKKGACGLRVPRSLRCVERRNLGHEA